LTFKWEFSAENSSRKSPDKRFVMVDHEIRQTPGDRAGFFSGYYVVIAAFFGMMIIFGAYHAFGVFFKPLLTEFGWTRAVTSGAFSLSQIVHGMLGIFMGGLTDRLGWAISSCLRLLAYGSYICSMD
jgi:hypothetical protein